MHSDSMLEEQQWKKLTLRVSRLLDVCGVVGDVFVVAPAIKDKAKSKPFLVELKTISGLQDNENNNQLCQIKQYNKSVGNAFECNCLKDVS